MLILPNDLHQPFLERVGGGVATKEKASHLRFMPGTLHCVLEQATTLTVPHSTPPDE